MGGDAGMRRSGRFAMRGGKRPEPMVCSHVVSAALSALSLWSDENVLRKLGQRLVSRCCEV
jgi:hypothetical protein